MELTFQRATRHKNFLKDILNADRLIGILSNIGNRFCDHRIVNGIDIRRLSLDNIGWRDFYFGSRELNLTENAVKLRSHND